MILGLLGSKVVRLVALLVVVVAVWKFNNGDVSKIVDSFIALLDGLSDQLIKVWQGFFD